MPNNLCRNRRQHICLTCQQWGCKQLNHFPQPVSAAQNFNQAGKSQAHVIVPPAQSPDLNVAGEIKQMLTDIKSELHSDMKPLTARIDKLETLPHSVSASQTASPQDIFSQVPAFGNPAITAVPSNLQISDLDLANKNILWTRVTSAGIPLHLPLDSCCSLSLVSKAHVEVICKTHPTMQFTKLSTPLPVSVANPHAQLKAIGTVQVPIIWENGRASIFSMLVVPHLAWPLLFGQNHLRMIQAHTNHAGLKVRFDHPSLKFTITCCDENRFVAFPSLANQNSNQPQKTVHFNHLDPDSLES